MNFTRQWSVKSHSDLFFWEVAIPVMLAVIPLFMWGDIQRLAHYMDKRWKRRRIYKVRLVFRSFVVSSALNGNNFGRRSGVPRKVG